MNSGPLIKAIIAKCARVLRLFLIFKNLSFCRWYVMLKKGELQHSISSLEG